MTGDRRDVRIRREGRRWQIDVCKESAPVQRTGWLSVGGCGDPRTALRVWLALLGGSERK